MNVAYLNGCDVQKRLEELERCCGATKWFRTVASGFPCADAATLKYLVDRTFAELDESDWLEAFSHHPRIGDIDSLRKKFASTANWASGEQSGTAVAGDEVLFELKSANDEYFNKFGFIFIICATGKSATEMLSALKARLYNDRATEVRNAAVEQQKITYIRLEKL
jgi:2-oxo-4-hydroxy-4-carboxy-5-ureidoimidazoline decarboxylase